MHCQDCRRRREDPCFQRPRRGTRISRGSGGSHLERPCASGRCGGDPLRRPARRTGHAGNALSHSLSQGPRPRRELRTHHRWALLGRYFRAVHRPHLARGGSRWPDCASRGRRHHQHRYRPALDCCCGCPSDASAPSRAPGIGQRISACHTRTPRLCCLARVRRDGHVCRQRRCSESEWVTRQWKIRFRTTTSISAVIANLTG